MATESHLISLHLLLLFCNVTPVLPGNQVPDKWGNACEKASETVRNDKLPVTEVSVVPHTSRTPGGCGFSLEPINCGFLEHLCVWWRQRRGLQPYIVPKELFKWGRSTFFKRDRAQTLVGVLKIVGTPPKNPLTFLLISLFSLCCSHSFYLATMRGIVSWETCICILHWLLFYEETLLKNQFICGAKEMCCLKVR